MTDLAVETATLRARLAEADSALVEVEGALDRRKAAHVMAEQEVVNLRTALAEAEGRASAFNELLDAAERAVRVWPHELRDSQLTTAIARARESAPAAGGVAAGNYGPRCSVCGAYIDPGDAGTQRVCSCSPLPAHHFHDTLAGFGGDDVHQVRDDVAAGGLEVKP